MKTPMKELIDEAIKYSRELSTKGCLPESLAVDHIIDVAESLLEKEKEVMSEIYAHDVSQHRELLKAFLQYVNCSDTDSKVSFDLLDKYLNSL